MTFGKSETVNRDTTAATITITLAGAATDSLINAAENAAATALASATASEPGSLSWNLATSSAACDSSTVYAVAVPTASHSTLVLDGNYRLCVRHVDMAGNTAWQTSGVIAFDKTPPVLSALSLSGDAADSIINAAETSNSTALAELR